MRMSTYVTVWKGWLWQGKEFELRDSKNLGPQTAAVDAFHEAFVGGSCNNGQTMCLVRTRGKVS